jgi:hypothetical protein
MGIKKRNYSVSERRLSTNITAAYQVDEYKQPIEDRTDNRFNFRAGLSWSPLKWLRLSATYEFIDFSTDAALRDHYQENKGYLSISFIPKTPIRFDRPASRKKLEEQLFNY